MANNSKLTEAGKLLKEIEDIYNRLGEKNPWKDVKEASVNLNKLKEDLKEAKDYLSLMSERSDELVSSFRAINDEISSSNKLYNVGVSSLGSLTSISTKLRDSQQKINTLSSDQVKTLQKKLNSEKSSLEGLQRQLSKKKELKI
jgi:chromosome segregation ATPase